MFPQWPHQDGLPEGKIKVMAPLPLGMVCKLNQHQLVLKPWIKIIVTTPRFSEPFAWLHSPREKRSPWV